MAEQDSGIRGIVLPPGGPSGYFVLLLPDRGPDDRVDLEAAARVLLRRWWQGLIAGLLGCVVAAAISLSLPNQYESKLLLAPVGSDTGGAAGALRSQLGGLASLAGINLSGISSDRRAEALATLSADGFIADFINTENILPELFPDRWDASKRAWKDPARAPTTGDGVRKFKRVQRVSEDRKTGLVTMVIRWTDREQAALWANQLVARLNAQLRQRAIEESRLRIQYLNQELAKSKVVAFQQAIYGLIESQMHASMLANVQPEYAFRTVDKAVPADAKRKVAPPRTAYTLAGGLFATLLWAAFLLWREREHWTAGRDALPAPSRN